MTSYARSIWIGFDPREADAFAVCRRAIKRDLTQPIPIYGLLLADLQARGFYTRPHSRDAEGRLIDELSIRPDFPGTISTEHANARFFVPHIAGNGWALFLDGDMLPRVNLARVFDRLETRFAVYCVKHNHAPKSSRKMDGQLQTSYPRKNWSSFCLFNCDHEAHKRRPLADLNRLPGLELQSFSHLADDEIGELDPAWNFLVGHSDPAIDPKVVHFTSGTPSMRGFEQQAFADDWRAERDAWARGRAW